MDSTVYDLFFAGTRILFLFIIPVILGASIAGLLASSLQAVTTIRDEVILYAVKIMAVTVVLYFTLPGFIESLLELAKISFSGSYR